MIVHPTLLGLYAEARQIEANREQPRSRPVAPRPTLSFRIPSIVKSHYLWHHGRRAAAGLR